MAAEHVLELTNDTTAALEISITDSRGDRQVIVRLEPGESGQVSPEGPAWSIGEPDGDEAPTPRGGAKMV
jgi:hypothetical protein